MKFKFLALSFIICGIKTDFLANFALLIQSLLKI
jgi:hypothetical protein